MNYTQNKKIEQVTDSIMVVENQNRAYKRVKANFENLTYFEYPKTVTFFTSKNEWPKLRDSGFLFFRKASSESVELLDFIDLQHYMQEGVCNLLTVQQSR